LAAVGVTVRPAGDGWVCEVTLEHSLHTVTVTASDLRRWGRGAGGESVEDLVRRSFEFLLEREPPSSILRRFDLSVIERYFPDYDQRMGSTGPA
jgi:hypothetical protein